MHPWGVMGNGQCHYEAAAIILDRLWQAAKIAHHWKRTSHPCSIRGRRKSQGTTSWSVPGKIMAQTLLGVISSREKVTGNRLYGKNKCRLSNLIAFCDEVTVSVHEGEQWLYLHFKTACIMVSHSIFVVKLEMYRLDGWTTRWVSNWVDC